MDNSPHLPILTYFLKKYSPINCLELGCSINTTPLIDSLSAGWVNSYHSSKASLAHFKDSYPQSELNKTDLIFYDNSESLLKYLGTSDQIDFAVIGGPVPDRLSVAQFCVDSGVRCIILLDYGFDACNYHKIRDNLGYDFRVFNNIRLGGETGVMVLNTLRYLRIIDHV